LPAPSSRSLLFDTARDFPEQEPDAAKSKAGKGAAGNPAFVPVGANMRPRRSFPCPVLRASGKEQIPIYGDPLSREG